MNRHGKTSPDLREDAVTPCISGGIASGGRQLCLSGTTGSVCVVAVPGSGKTRLISTAVAADVQAGMAPARLLILTFAREAADTLKDRIERLAGAGELPQIRTIHGWCYSVIRKYHQEMGFSSCPRPLDAGEQRRFITEYGQYDRDVVDGILSAYAWARNKKCRSEEMIERVPLPPAETIKLFLAYKAFKREENVVDFEEMQSKVLELFQQRPDLLTAVRAEVEAIYLDEAQDSSALQWEILLSLKARMFVVGDPNQAIYGWRGGVSDFRSFLPDAEEHTLRENYRSTPEIVALADRIFPTGIHTRNASGEKPVIFGRNDPFDEARQIVDLIEMLGSRPCTIGVLARTWDQLWPIEFILRLSEISYDSAAPSSWVSGRGLARFLDVLKWANSRNNHDWPACAKALGFKRIKDAPTDRLKLLGKSIETFTGSEVDAPKFYALRDLKIDQAPGEVKFDRLYTGFYRQHVDEDSRLERLQGYVNRIGSNAYRLRRLHPDARLTLSTVHAQKGAEFDHVFVCGLADGVFPSALSDDAEEERRLFYVATTRPRQTMFLSFPFEDLRGRRVRRSRFLGDIDGPALGYEIPAGIVCQPYAEPADAEDIL